MKETASQRRGGGNPPDRMTKLYFDDIALDRVVEFGDYEMTKGEIISFGRPFDPQPFHTKSSRRRAAVFIS